MVHATNLRKHITYDTAQDSSVIFLECCQVTHPQCVHDFLGCLSTGESNGHLAQMTICPLLSPTWTLNVQLSCRMAPQQHLGLEFCDVIQHGRSGIRWPAGWILQQIQNLLFGARRLLLPLPATLLIAPPSELNLTPCSHGTSSTCCFRFLRRLDT